MRFVRLAFHRVLLKFVEQVIGKLDLSKQDLVSSAEPWATQHNAKIKLNIKIKAKQQQTNEKERKNQQKKEQSINKTRSRTVLYTRCCITGGVIMGGT